MHKTHAHPWTIRSHPCPPKTHGYGWAWAWVWVWAPNVGLSYVAIPQHGPLSLYTKLKGPMDFKGPCISMVTASHTYPCAFLLMRVVSLPLNGKSLAPMESFCNHTLALSSQRKWLSGTWPAVHFLESMTEAEWGFMSWLSVHFLDSPESPLHFDFKSRLQINMGVAIMSWLRSWAARIKIRISP
jgi:hypothetical protein